MIAADRARNKKSLLPRTYNHTINLARCQELYRPDRTTTGSYKTFAVFDHTGYPLGVRGPIQGTRCKSS